MHPHSAKVSKQHDLDCLLDTWHWSDYGLTVDIVILSPHRLIWVLICICLRAFPDVVIPGVCIWVPCLQADSTSWSTASPQSMVLGIYVAALVFTWNWMVLGLLCCFVAVHAAILDVCVVSLARQASAGRLMLCLCYFLSSSFIVVIFFSRVCVVYAVLEANGKVNGIGEILHPCPS